MTAEFLELDRVLARGDEAVAAAGPGELSEGWARVRSGCEAPIAAYLAAAAPERGAPVDQVGVLRGLRTARSRAEDFLRRHATEVAAAAGAAARLPGRLDTALAATEELLQVYREFDVSWRGRRSLSSARSDLLAARDEVRRVRGSGVPETERALEDLDTALRHARQVADEAPGAVERARNSVASVRTRAEAAETRRAQLGRVHKELLRGFALANHDDLGQNDRLARQALDRAAAAMREAETTDPGQDPDGVLDAVARVRRELTTADRLIDAVRDRLETLRRVEQDPGQAAEAARFRIRDARALARTRGVEAGVRGELDAQEQRLHRARAALEVAHPDYLLYLTELDRIEQFVAGTIERIRTGRR